MKQLIGPKRFVAGCALVCSLIVAATAVAASPADFVDEAHAAGIAQIETSRMAISKTSSTDIESYAVEAIKDHTNANRDLKDLASRLGLQVSSDEQILDKAKKLMLQVQEGDSFDAAYAANQVKAHEQAIELYKEQAQNPESPELQAFAEKYLPKLEMHLLMAQKLVDAHHKS